MSAADASIERPARHPYQYVVLRCVPRVDREEFLNVGVLLHCQALDLLAVRWHVDEARLGAAFPDLDLAMLCRSLEFVDAVCAGTEAAGAAAGHTLSARFGFLKAPRSTIVQPGPVHGGISAEPLVDLDRLLAALIAPAPAG